jgi:hypothetical protein
MDSRVYFARDTPSLDVAVFRHQFSAFVAKAHLGLEGKSLRHVCPEKPLKLDKALVVPTSPAAAHRLPAPSAIPLARIVKPRWFGR